MPECRRSQRNQTWRRRSEVRGQRGGQTQRACLVGTATSTTLTERLVEVCLLQKPTRLIGCGGGGGWTCSSLFLWQLAGGAVTALRAAMGRTCQCPADFAERSPASIHRAGVTAGSAEWTPRRPGGGRKRKKRGKKVSGRVGASDPGQDGTCWGIWTPA